MQKKLYSKISGESSGEINCKRAWLQPAMDYPRSFKQTKILSDGAPQT